MPEARATRMDRWEEPRGRPVLRDTGRSYRYDRDLTPHRTGLRKPFLVAAVFHVLLAIPFVVTFHSHPPLTQIQRKHVINVVSLAAPPRARVTREPLPTAPHRTPVPPRKVEPKVEKATPKVVPNEQLPAPPPKKRRAQPDLPKVGSEDTTRVARSELPAVGNLRGMMAMWAEGEALPYSYYFEVLQTKIASYWEPPSSLDRSPGEVAAVIRFRIERPGTVSNRYVEEPSGSNAFDTAALRALDFSTPFPPLPEEYPGNSLIIHLRFVYSP
jgi:TonB family protein